jgi:hypothetical protein
MVHPDRALRHEAAMQQLLLSAVLLCLTCYTQALEAVDWR